MIIGDFSKKEVVSFTKELATSIIDELENGASVADINCKFGIASTRFGSLLRLGFDKRAAEGRRDFSEKCIAALVKSGHMKEKLKKSLVRAGCPESEFGHTDEAPVAPDETPGGSGMEYFFGKVFMAQKQAMAAIAELDKKLTLAILTSQAAARDAHDKADTALTTSEDLKDVLGLVLEDVNDLKDSAFQKQLSALKAALPAAVMK